MEAEIFLNYLRNSINNIDERYYHKERIFCYELYYKLKIHMANNNEIIDEIVLHSELPKRRLDPQTAHDLGLTPLEQLMSPDFLLHEENTGNHQLVAIEVKADKNLGHAKLLKDLQKLHQLKTHYLFQYGVFLGINITMHRLVNMIRTHRNDYITLDGNIILIAKNPNTQLNELTLQEILDLTINV
jgi:hypothetical protein